MCVRWPDSWRGRCTTLASSMRCSRSSSACAGGVAACLSTRYVSGLVLPRLPSPAYMRFSDIEREYHLPSLSVGPCVCCRTRTTCSVRSRGRRGAPDSRPCMTWRARAARTASACTCHVPHSRISPQELSRKKVFAAIIHACYRNSCLPRELGEEARVGYSGRGLAGVPHLVWGRVDFTRGHVGALGYLSDPPFLC